MAGTKTQDLRPKTFLLVVLLAVAAVAAQPANACTSILVSRGASVDGSVMITYSCDDAGNYASLGILPAADHKPGEVIEVGPFTEKGPRGKIPQVPHTYRINSALMNEYQLSLSETTFGGRTECNNPQGLLTYGHMMMLALQRAKTARDAIQVMVKLMEEHGYGDVGESISVADPHEVWIFEVVGTGPGGKGAVWVAARVPDGQISCHTNASRIGEIPRDDPTNWIYSDNVESFAVRKGWYDPKSGQPFRFNDAYGASTPFIRHSCDMRTWSILRRAAPSQHFSPDYHLSKPGAQPYPLFIKPDHKLSAADVCALMRDHFEGTPWDMTQGIDAGPFGSPRRWRPVPFKVDGVDYAWGRPISTQQTGFCSVTQSRAWLPDSVGGLIWYCMDDSYTSCFVPIYCNIETLPKSFCCGGIEKFSWDSAWWIFNLAANLAYARYSDIIPEIREVQKELEGNFTALQPAVEKTAVELSKTNPGLANRYLTDYSVMHAEQTTIRWRALVEHLITKYNDGYIRDPRQHKSVDASYPEAWLRRVIKDRGEQLRVPVEKPVEKPAK